MAWHFTNNTLRDGRPVPQDGEILRHSGKPKLCVSGLHASKRLIDALKYAPGSTICYVAMGGEIMRGDDKLVAAERTILWRIDGEALLREFARWSALQVIHLWDAPDIVRQYLETGDESIRHTAWVAADTAWDAVWVATRGAVWDAAWDAARHTARDAARHTTWDAARHAALDAAWAAAKHAVREAARDAAWNTMINKANDKLEQMVMAQHKKALKSKKT